MSERAGRPYRPSNGTEGMRFEESWCCRCRRDQATYDDSPDGPGDGCDIVGRAMLFEIGEPEYPTEWVYGPDGKPCCTAFEDIGKPPPAERIVPMPGQMALFDGDAPCE